MDLIEGAIVVLGSIICQLIYYRAKNLGRFDGAGKARVFLFNVALLFAFMVLPSIVYGIWQMSGFTNADARQAAQSMIDKSMQRGARKAEAEFIVVSHSRMTGYVTVTEQDGSQTTLSCEATMGQGGRYLTACRQ